MRAAWHLNSDDFDPTRPAVKRSTSDVVIIGAGMGGSTTALTLAPTGANILILEQGAQIRAEPLNRDTKAIFQKGAYTPQEKWFDTAGHPHAAGTTEPWRKKGLPNPPVPDEPPIAALRERFKKAGLHPYSLPLGVDIRTWL